MILLSEYIQYKIEAKDTKIKAAMRILIVEKRAFSSDPLDLYQ